MLTDEELAAIAARVDAATPAPWSADFTGDDFQPRTYDGAPSAAIRGGGYPFTQEHEMRVGEVLYEREADVQFITHARDDIPALLAEVERLRQIISEQPRDQLKAEGDRTMTPTINERLQEIDERLEAAANEPDTASAVGHLWIALSQVLEALRMQQEQLAQHDRNLIELFRDRE